MIKSAALTRQRPPEADDPEPPAFEFLRTAPLASRSKVVWIQDAERMNASTANGLLKTLEEPPDYGRFVLTTTSVGSLPPTILSRCVAIACEIGESADQERWVLDAAQGTPGRIREILEHEHAYRAIAEFAQSLPRMHVHEALSASDRFAALADALQQALDCNARTADAEALEVLASVYGGLPDHRPGALLEMADAHRRIVGNANPGLVFDALFAKVLR